MAARQDFSAKARGLRKRQTDAERALWSRLRNKELAGIKFRRQQAVGPYIVDFVSFQAKLIVEVDGGQHNQPRRMANDDGRDKWLHAQGFQVLRFWNSDVLKNIDGVLERISAALSPEFHPHPNPLPSRERDSLGEPGGCGPELAH